MCIHINNLNNHSINNQLGQKIFVRFIGKINNITNFKYLMVDWDAPIGVYIIQHNNGT